jgi:hypothetical protein
VQVEEVFRSANDRIAEKGRELGWRFPVPFLCECSERRCFGRVELTLEEYEQLRSHPERYMTLPSHEVEGAVPLEGTGRVACAESSAAIARRSRGSLRHNPGRE